MDPPFSFTDAGGMSKINKLNLSADIFFVAKMHLMTIFFKVSEELCDQIGRIIGRWVTF